MTPQECIDSLDRALAEVGEVVILRRTVSSVNYDVDCPAREDMGALQEIAAGITQTTSKLIISPTPLRNAGWPNQPITTEAPFDPDPIIPKKGDIVIRQGRSCRIELVKPIPVQNEIVRIELTVTG